nr:hypothetical protein [Tanacetum cinerariifolium]
MYNLIDIKLNEGYVAFGGNPKGGKIIGKGKIKTGKLDFDDVYFVKELKFNLFSVSQMCDKKNNVLFTDTECLVLSSNFKLPDASQVLLRVLRENNTLGHVNFKSINKLVKGNLVRGLPTKVFTNDNSCVACKKCKQHRVSCKSKTVSSVDQPLFRLHMDLFGPTFVKSLSKKSYCLVITDDYSRFSWVFFLASKDETTPVLKTFIIGLKNLLSLKVKNNNKDALVDRKEHDDDIQKYVSLDIHSSSSCAQTRKQGEKTENKDKGKSHVVTITGFRDLNADTNDFSDAGPSNDAASPTAANSSSQDASTSTHDLNMPNLEDLTHSDDADDVGAEADINNLESIISCRSGVLAGKWQEKEEKQGAMFRRETLCIAKCFKRDAAEGFEQIIDFLSGSYIHYALTVNPHIYISCIKQFWNTPSVKRSGDVTSQWKFLIHTILQSLRAKRTSWNEFSTAMASAVICLSKGQRFNLSKKVGKGFSGVETPLFEGMLAVRQPAEEEVAKAQVQVVDAVAAAVEETVAEDKLLIIKLKARVKRLEKANMVKSSKLRCLRKVGASKQVESSNAMEDVFNQGRMIDDMDKDEGIELVKDAEEDDSEVQKVVEVVTTTKLITEVFTATASQVSTAIATIPAAKPIVAAYTRRKKGVIIRDPKEELPLKTLAETPKVKDKGKGMTYAQICPIFQAMFDENIRFLFKSSVEMEEEDQEIIKSINETPEQKAAKRRKLSEEAQEAKDLRKHLEVVEDEDDD